MRISIARSLREQANFLRPGKSESILLHHAAVICSEAVENLIRVNSWRS